MLYTYILYGIYILLRIYYYVLIAGILVTWIPNFRNNKFLKIIRSVSDAYLEPFHGILTIGFLDFTPLIGFGVYNFLVYVIGTLI